MTQDEIDKERAKLDRHWETLWFVGRIYIFGWAAITMVGMYQLIASFF